MKSAINKSNSYRVDGILYMCCHKCGREVRGVGDEAVSVTCSICVLATCDFPEEPKSYKPTGRPAGWHWMNEFVDKDGNVFHKGKEQPKLKGKLKPTKVRPPKKTKRRTREQILLARNKEKKAALKKAVKKQKDFLNHKIDKG
jgi:hypothetical protein|tara:strand:+ start:416 stop:844 length:429 start_codon:yes stop_codon:yes gene_type:complete